MAPKMIPAREMPILFFLRREITPKTMAGVEQKMAVIIPRSGIHPNNTPIIPKTKLAIPIIYSPFISLLDFNG